MNVLVYATTFGADLLSTVRDLEAREDVTVKVLLNDPEGFKNEPIFKYKPLKSELIKNTTLRKIMGIYGYKADVTIMDNRVPYLNSSPKGLMLWHGFGWKGPNDEIEFRSTHRAIRRIWGNAKVFNKNFIWQCYGPFDYEHRTKVSGFHPDNCVQLGSASHDELRNPIDKREVQEFYPFDIVNKPTLLIAPTWHYGEVFAHWGHDETIFKALIKLSANMGVNVILRFHDSFRFEKQYIEKVKRLEAANDHVFLKFKDQHPDNFLDLQVSDILMTNFSSIANLFYATGKPTLHIYPVKHEDEEFMWRKLTIAGIRKRKVDSVKFIWKFPPEDNGGLLAHSFDELVDQFKMALENPDCCRDKAKSFVDKHMLGADGNNRKRIYDTLKMMINS